MLPEKSEKVEEPEVEVTPVEEPKVVEVDLTKEQEKPSEQESNQKILEEIKKERARSEYLNRQADKKLRQITEYQPPAPKTATQVKEDPNLTKDQINLMAEKDWQDAVDYKIEQGIKKGIEEQDKKRQEEASQLDRQNQTEDSRGRVLKRYPNIEDEQTDENRYYRQVMNENPALLSNPSGAELAMYRMEELMRQNGKQPEPMRQEIETRTNTEVNRRMRAGIGSVSQGQPVNNGDKITLTQDEIDLAKSMNIPLAQYGRMKRIGERGGFKEGVTVDDEREE